LGIETRIDDEKVDEQIRFLLNRDSWITVSAERAFLKKLEGGCQVPIAAFARILGTTLQIDGLVGTVDGKRLIGHHREGPMERAEGLGTELAEALMEKGAREILNEVYQRKGPVVDIP
jgi:hydroxymethylbilane synthase